MNSTSSTSSHLAAASAVGAAAGCALLGVIQLTHESSGESTTIGAVEHVAAGVLSVTCLLFVPVLLALGRHADRDLPARLACAGLVILAVLATISNVRGTDPSYFAAVAVPVNLCWLGGLIALAIALRRNRRLPRALAVGLPLSWMALLPLSPLGGGILAGAYWLLIARELAPAAERIPARTAVAGSAS